ncbi:MAG TPA: hypothetical protein VK459_15315, partial [Polyangiaceae bacterium]|nr:hypothetical protein [Polyangiaceae bacterium]
MPAAHHEDAPGELLPLVVAVQKLPERPLSLEEPRGLRDGQRSEGQPQRALRVREHGQAPPACHEHARAASPKPVAELLKKAIPARIERKMSARVAAERAQVGLEVIEHEQDPLGSERIEQIVAELLGARFAGQLIARRDVDPLHRVLRAPIPVGGAREREATVEL